MSAPGQPQRLVTPAELPAEADDLDHANGIVESLASVGLPATDIAAAKQRFPNLDTDYVLSAGWEWTDTKSPVDLEVGFFKWIIGFVALLSALRLEPAVAASASDVGQRLGTVAGGAWRNQMT